MCCSTQLVLLFGRMDTELWADLGVTLYVAFWAPRHTVTFGSFGKVGRLLKNYLVTLRGRLVCWLLLIQFSPFKEQKIL